MATGKKTSPSEKAYYARAPQIIAANRVKTAKKVKKLQEKKAAKLASRALNPEVQKRAEAVRAARFQRKRAREAAFQTTPQVKAA